VLIDTKDDKIHLIVTPSSKGMKKLKPPKEKVE